MSFDLADIQFDCLDSISDGGALCPIPKAGVFVAKASPKVTPDHKGWSVAVVYALYVLRLLQKAPSGEYTITKKGKEVCLAQRGKRKAEAIRSAAEASPGKVVLMTDFKRGIAT